MLPDVERFEDLARGEDAVRVQGLLDRAHRGDLFRRVLQGEERGFREADAVLARDRPTEFDDLLHHLADGLFGLAAVLRIEPVIHDVDVKVAVGGVAERRRRQTEAVADFAGEAEQVDVAADRHHHVFIEFGVAEGEHRLRAGTAKFPERFGFRGVFRRAEGDRVTLRPGDDLDRVVREGGGMSVDLDQQGGVRLGGAA